MRSTGKEVFYTEDPKEIELVFRLGEVNIGDVEDLDLKKTTKS